MEFRTQISTAPFERKISHRDHGLSVGSCFAESIARKLTDAKFPILGNPFGVLYNPISIAQMLGILHSRHHFTDNDLVRDGDIWHSFAFHGSFSSTDAGMTLAAMNRAVEQGADALQKAEYVIITFGTAWVYELEQTPGSDPSAGFGDTDEYREALADLYRMHTTGRVVANCHKFPSAMFRRRRLTVAEIVDIYSRLLEGPLQGKHVIMTVSPIRHLKDGLAENTLSKATLVMGIHELADKYWEVDYFPSFEIMNDDLRDYRFYCEDMVHPTDTAIEYIWEVFGRYAFTRDTAEAAADMERLTAAVRHRPFNPESESHARFMENMAARVEKLRERYPDIDLTGELNYFRQ